MKFKINLSGLAGLAAKVNKQSVKVSVPDHIMAAVPVRGTINKRDGVTTRTQNHKARSKVKLKFVLGILNKRRGILKDAVSNLSKAERERIAAIFVELATAKKSASFSKITQIERLCVNAVRDPILKKRYGPNAPETIDEKGFDNYAVDTGRLIKSLQGKYKR